MMIWLIPAFIGAAIVGILIGIILIIRKRKNDKANEVFNPENFIKNQVYIATVSPNDITPWFKSEAKKCKSGHPHGVLLMLKPEISEPLGFTGDKALDPEHYLIQIIYDGEFSGEIDPDRLVTLRIINFDKISQEVKKAMGEKEIILVRL